MTKRDSTTHIVVHCSASRPSADIGVKELRRIHVEDNGWSDVGYHLVIRRNGLIEAGRHLDDIGAHVAGFNSRSVGVCLVGGLYQTGVAPDDDFAGVFTQEQASALRDVLYFLKGMYPSAEIVGHRDLSPDKNKDGRIDKRDWLKQCPCFDVASFCKGIGL